MLDDGFVLSVLPFQPQAGAGIPGVIALVAMNFPETLTLIKIDGSGISGQGNGPGFSWNVFYSGLQQGPADTFAIMLGMNV
jgi:hypothetical protein